MTRAFTLIELVATTALAALLMIACVAVLRSVELPQPGSADNDAPTVAALIRWDIAQATHWHQEDAGLLLVGFGHIDPATLAPTQRPAAVRYELTIVGDNRWLSRTQTPLDAGGGADRQLLSTRIAGLRLADITPSADAVTDDPFGDDVPGDTTMFRSLVGVTPLPTALRVTLQMQRGTTQTFTEFHP